MPCDSHAGATGAGSGTVRRSLLVALMLGQTWLATDAHERRAAVPRHGSRSRSRSSCCSRSCSAGSRPASGPRSRASCCSARARPLRDLAHRRRRDAPIAADARTAIVMPICNEDVPRVFAGLRATYESLARTGDARALRLLRAVRHERSRHARRRGRRVARRCAARSTASAASSIAGAAPHQAQERQHRRLLPALGHAATATWSCSTPTA